MLNTYDLKEINYYQSFKTILTPSHSDRIQMYMYYCEFTENASPLDNMNE